MALARATASASVSKGARAATGPKVSSCMIARVGGDVGEDGRGVEVRAEVEALAAGEEAGALGEGVGDLGLLLGDGAGVDQRADVGVGVAGADGERGGRPAAKRRQKSA